MNEVYDTEYSLDTLYANRPFILVARKSTGTTAINLEYMFGLCLDSHLIYNM